MTCGVKLARLNPLPTIQRLARRALGVQYQDFDDFWYKATGRPTPAGINVSADIAMATSAVYGCVRVLAETMASMSLHVYQRSDGSPRSKQIVRDHPLSTILRSEPNKEQDSFSFREMLMGHCALRGNSYAAIRYNRAGEVSGLWPLHPDATTPKRTLETRRIYYEVREKDKPVRNVPAYNILHLRGLTDDGLIGLGPLQLMRNQIGAVYAADDYTGRFWANDGTPRGLLRTPNQLGTTPDQSKLLKDAIRASWDAMTTGDARHSIPVLDRDLQWQSVGIDPESAQMLETRRFGVAEIARAFRVPLVLLQETDKTTSWGSGIEQFMIAFIIHTMRPWAVRWEQAINRALLGEDEKGTIFVEFNLDSMIRGDIGARYNAYAVGRNWGWLSVNDIRDLENMNPVGPEGDTYLQPLNMGLLGQEPPDPQNDGERETNESATAAARLSLLTGRNGNGNHH